MKRVKRGYWGIGGWICECKNDPVVFHAFNWHTWRERHCRGCDCWRPVLKGLPTPYPKKPAEAEKGAAHEET